MTIPKRLCRPIHVDFFHGWGFNALFWQPLQRVLAAELRREDIPFDFETHDRGYFGLLQKESSPKSTPPKDGLRIVVTHSFGLHWCPGNILASADVLVTFCGFNAFHIVTALNESTPISAMAMAWQRNPGAVLSRFYRNVFYPDTLHSEAIPAGAPSEVGRALLYHDLMSMQFGSLPSDIVHEIPKKVLICGGSDHIVSKAASLQFLKEFPAMHFVLHEHAGHALPLTHAEISANGILSPIRNRFIHDLSR